MTDPIVRILAAECFAVADDPLALRVKRNPAISAGGPARAQKRRFFIAMRATDPRRHLLYFVRDPWPWGKPHEAAGIHHIPRRRGRLAARGASAAADDAGDRVISDAPHHHHHPISSGGKQRHHRSGCRRSPVAGFEAACHSGQPSGWCRRHRGGQGSRKCKSRWLHAAVYAGSPTGHRAADLQESWLRSVQELHSGRDYFQHPANAGGHSEPSGRLDGAVGELCGSQSGKS